MGNPQETIRIKKDPTFLQSISALLVLVALIGVGTMMYNLRVEFMMIIAAAFSVVMAIRNGFTWKELQDGMNVKLGGATSTILIIFTIGMLIASFMFAGSIPMLIYYGIIYLNPKYVLLAAMLGCIVFSVLTGSSWGSIGTVGVAFLGISMSLDVPLHITAGAAVCGACFGDKLSPLSGTTNLAAGAAGVDLYTHIRSMMWTTLPPTIIAGIVFFFVGNSLNIETVAMPENALEMVNQLDAAFTWGIVPLLPFAIVLAGALTKQPPLPSMLVAVFTAVLIGVFYQGFSMQDGVYATLYGFKGTMIPDSGEFGKAANTLLNRGGARSMVGTILIIYIGFCYAAIITKAGFLERAVRPLAQVVKTRLSIMAAALVTDGVLMAFSGSSPPATIMVPVMFKKLFLKARMPARTLSRSLEDVGTITTSFFPWTAEAVFYVTTMGVEVYGPQGFAPWFIVGYLTPLLALFYAWSGKGVYLMNDEERDKALADHEEEIKAL